MLDLIPSDIHAFIEFDSNDKPMIVLYDNTENRTVLENIINFFENKQLNIRLDDIEGLYDLSQPGKAIIIEVI